MARKAIVATAFFIAVSAWGQTTTVAGKLQTYSPSIAPNALGNYVEFALTNCGNNTPQVSGSAVLLSKPVDFFPDATGALTAAANGGSTPSLYGNDVISCGGAFTSRYSVRYFVGGIAQGPAKFYFITSATPFDLTTAVPINLQPPLNPPYPNLTICPAGQYTIGLNKDLSVKCVNLPSGASNAIVSNPAGSQFIAQPVGTSFRPNEIAAIRIVDGLTYTTIQQALAAAGTNGMVIIPPDFVGSSSFVNGNNVSVWDLRIGGGLFSRQSIIFTAAQFLQFQGLASALLKVDGTGKVVAAIAGTDYSSPGTGVTSFNTRAGAVTLTLADVTGAGGANANGSNATGTWNSNANTASALAAVPSQCSGGTVSTGIATNGNANCTTSSIGIVQSFSVSGCTTPASTDGACQGTIILPAAMPDATYFPQLTLNATSFNPASGGGPFLSIEVSGALTTTTIPYNITCTFGCGVSTTNTIYVTARHN